MGVVGERRLARARVVDHMAVVLLGRNGEVCGEGMGGDERNGAVFPWRQKRWLAGSQVFMVRRLIEKCRPLYREREFRVLLALNLLLGLAYSFVVPFLSMFGTREVGMSEPLFGVFMVTTALSAIFFGTVLAHFSDTRFSRRAMLILGSVAGALGYGAYAYLREVWALMVVGALILGVASITFSQVFALARETINRLPGAAAQGAFYINGCRMFFALAWTVGPAMASWVMVAYSYEGLFLCTAGCFLAFAVVVWRYVPADVRVEGGAKPPASPLREVLKRGDALAHFVGFVLLFASGTIGMMNLPLFTLEELAGTERHIGIMYSVAPVFELPFMFYFGVLASRSDPARVIRLGALIAVAYYGLLTLVRAPWHVYPLQILSAAVVAVTSGVAITYFQKYLPGHPGTATNLYATASKIGSTVGYMLFGTLAWRLGHRAVFGCCLGFSAVALGLLCVRGKLGAPSANDQ